VPDASSPAQPHHQAEYRVRFDEAGPDGKMRSSTYLRWAQDLAWRHSEAAGLARDWYRQRSLTWLIRAVELDVATDLDFGTAVTVSTEVIGFRRVWARRRTTFVGADRGGISATALTDWVLLGESGLPARVPDEISQRFAGAAATFSPLRVNLPEAPRGASWREFAVRLSEVDPMGHVNNAAYIDYVDEHLAATDTADLSRRLPRRLRAEFQLPAEPGADLVGRGWSEGGGWCYRLSDSAGRELFRARLDSDPGLLVGG
jgi:acyl-ACP thioesterase